MISVLLIAQAAVMDPLTTGAHQARSEACRCSIEFKVEVELGSLRDTVGRFGDTQSLGRDSRGRWYVLKPGHRDRVFVYSQRGEFERSFWPGGVPTENVSLLGVDQLDSVFVFDAGRAELSVVGPSFRGWRRIPLPGTVHAAVKLQGRKWIISAIVRTPERIGIPLHVLEGDTISLSFGRGGAFRPDRPMEGIHVLSAASDSTIWSVGVTEQTADEWSSAGTRLRSVRFAVPGFRTWESGERWSEREAPGSLIASIRSDERGRLWILANVAGSRWRSLLRSVEGPDGKLWLPTQWTGFLDSHLLVVDPTTERTVFSARLPFFARGFLPGDRLLVVSGTPNEAGRLHVLSFDPSALEGGTQSRRE